jgi:hypothetical protein
MAWRYYSKRELANLLNVSGEHFHKEIKKIIKRDFKKEMKPYGFDNPDILLNEDHIMALADPDDHNVFFETPVSIFAYIEEEDEDSFC